jgi:hypothetical protein
LLSLTVVQFFITNPFLKDKFCICQVNIFLSYFCLHEVTDRLSADKSSPAWKPPAEVSKGNLKKLQSRPSRISPIAFLKEELRQIQSHKKSLWSGGMG